LGTGIGLAGAGGAGAAWRSPPIQVPSYSFCPVYYVGRSGNLYYYMAMRCPYTGGGYFGMTLPVRLYSSQLGCGSAYCVPGSSPRAPSATDSGLAVRSAPRPPGKELPGLDPGMVGTLEALPRHVWGNYPDGRSLAEGLREIPAPMVPTFECGLVRRATYRLGRARLGDQERGFLVYRLEAVAPDVPGVTVIAAGHEVAPVDPMWPEYKLGRNEGAIYQAEVDGEIVEILMSAQAEGASK
jgi:hypothetical protein